MLSATFRWTFIFLCATSISLWGQITGELKGLVTDQSGAAVGNAKVVLRSTDTGETRGTSTDEAGLFAFNLLKIGNYQVRVEASGFRATDTPAQVRAGEVSSVRLSLEVGQVTETVTVSESVLRLDVENAQVQRAFTGSPVLDLPVNRNPNNFALASPGVAPVTDNNPFLGSGSFNSNGGRGRGNNITIDGITATDVSVTGTGGTIDPLIFQTIQEVKIITNNFSSEYGRNSSSQVLYLTKSGTNMLHGEVFEFFQNDKLNARPFFDTTGQTNIVRYNQYGFVVGGPVFIPKIADLRNKVFWMFGYEGQKQRGAGASRIARVPTPQMMESVTDPTALQILQTYQVPTSPTGQLTTQGPNTADVWKWNLRGDFVLSERDTLWLRYNPASSEAVDAGLAFVGSNLPGFGATSAGTPRQAIAAHTHVFGASAVNEFRFGFGQSDAGFPIDTPYPLGPRITFQSGEVTGLGVWEGLPQGREQRTYQFNNNFSFQTGRHNIKLGAEVYYLQADSTFDALQRPTLAFATFDDFAVGRPATYQQRFGSSMRQNRVTNVFGFAQDDWKVTRNFTLNLGVRWERAGGPKELNGTISNLDLGVKTPYGAAGAGPFGLLQQGQPSFFTNNNWAPRVGFAWSLGQKTVLRGGYGMAYDFVFLNPITNQRFLPPFIVTGTLSGQGSFVDGNSFSNIVGGTSTIQQQTAAQVGNLSTSVLNWGAISPAIDFNLNNSQVQQWNFGIQQETVGGIVVKASYVGTKGNFLPRGRDLNLIANQPAPATSLDDETVRLADFQTAFQRLNGGATQYSNRIDPRYNAIVYTESSANSSYHSAQLEVERRFARGFFFNANYTFGKSIDDNSDVLNVLINDSPNQQNPRNNRDNRAPSQFDLRHRFVLVADWQLPWGRGSSNWFVRSVAAGWSIAGITTFRSGFPVTFDSAARRGINPLTVLGGGAQVRPNAAGTLDPQFKPAGSEGAPFGTINPAGVQAVSAYANSLGLSQPLLGNFGSLGRNTFRLNGMNNFDLNAYKNFNIREGVYFQLRGEFYNAFNNTAFQDIDRNITSTTFGQYQTVAQNARVIQLGARFVF